MGSGIFEARLCCEELANFPPLADLCSFPRDAAANPQMKDFSRQ